MCVESGCKLPKVTRGNFVPIGKKEKEVTKRIQRTRYWFHLRFVQGFIDKLKGSGHGTNYDKTHGLHDRERRKENIVGRL